VHVAHRARRLAARVRPEADPAVASRATTTEGGRGQPASSAQTRGLKYAKSRCYFGPFFIHMPEPETNAPVPPPTPAAASAAEAPKVEPKADEAARAGEAKPSADDLAAQLATAKAEAAASQDRLLRVAADLENFRRRTVREKDELRVAATGRVMEDIFPVLDTLAMAVVAARQPKAELKTLVDGVEMVLAQLKNALVKHGLKEINPLGQPFDPHQHEAISHQPHAEIKEEHVMAVVRIGYALNGRLLRAASVVVSSGPAKEEKQS
jgi:molecular chaperone GrpE